MAPLSWTATGADGLVDLLREWDANSCVDQSVHPLLHSDFLTTAVAEFADGDISILAGRDHGQLKIVFPVCFKGRFRYQSFSPSQLPITPLLVRDRGIEPTDLTGIASALGKEPLLLLDLLRYDERFLPSLDTSDSRIEHKLYCSTMDIDGTLGFSDYWSLRSKKLRDNIKRYFKRVKTNGYSTRLNEYRDPDMLDLALAEYCKIESSGWKGRAGTAIHAGNEQGRFYSRLLQKFGARGNARIFELCFDQKVVASRIFIQSEGMVVFLKTTYREDYSSFSPGRLLLYLTLEKLLGDSTVASIELCANVTPDQAQWASTVRPLHHVSL